MRTLLALALVLALAAPARAGVNYRQLKIAGIIVTFAGAGLTILGAGLIGGSYVGDVRNNVGGFDVNLRTGGIGTLVLGMVAVGGGITMWVIGAKGGVGRASLVPAIGRDQATASFALSF